MVRRPSPEAAKLYASYVPVRITDMRGVDLNVWTFDWDLTFAAMAMGADGTVLHRFGSRDARPPEHWLTAASWQQFLEAGLRSHRAARGGDPPRAPEAPALTIEGIPAFAERDRGECIHCHSARPALRIEAQKRGDWNRDMLWVYPPPSTVGIDLDRNNQALVTEVAPGSPAAKAGLRAGDRLANFATATDFMAWLDGLSAEGAKEPLEIVPAGEAKSRNVELELPAGWKAYGAKEFAWRPSKWGLSPAPGFGGPVLDAPALAKLGLSEDAFAFEVDYLVTWGENQRWGKAAAAAGVRDGMIVLGTEEKRDFLSIDHFHAWWRLQVEPGSTVRLAIWKHGELTFIRLPVGKR